MKLMTILVLIPWVNYITTHQLMNVFLQKCYGSCNKKYCNLTIKCRPFNRTSKLTAYDSYFNPGVKLEAPLYMEATAFKKFRTLYRPHMFHMKEELCGQLSEKSHPIFQMWLKIPIQGNWYDPCPFTGYRYIKPGIASHSFLPLVPVGEWRVDYNITKPMNKTNEYILSWSEFFEIRPTSAQEF